MALQLYTEYVGLASQIAERENSFGRLEKSRRTSIAAVSLHINARISIGARVAERNCCAVSASPKYMIRASYETIARNAKGVSPRTRINGRATLLRRFGKRSWKYIDCMPKSSQTIKPTNKRDCVTCATMLWRRHKSIETTQHTRNIIKHPTDGYLLGTVVYVCSGALSM